MQHDSKHQPRPWLIQWYIQNGVSNYSTGHLFKFAGCIKECATPQWNSNFRMVCGQGAPTYSWYKDGIPLDSSSYIVGEKERIVVVTNETRDPFGLYTCKTSDVIRQWYLPVQESRGTEDMPALVTIPLLSLICFVCSIYSLNFQLHVYIVRTSYIEGILSN